MAWKVERWLEEVFPGEDKIYSEYRLLPRRELVIVACAVLDCALAQLLHSRLGTDKAEVESFLGLSGDGRAPCASFGARIQLAYLTKLITRNDLIAFRLMKNIRNVFAHRVKADFTSKEVLPLISQLNEQFRQQLNNLIRSGALKGGLHEQDPIKPHLSRVPEAGAGLFLAVFTIYHAYLHRLSGKVKPVDELF